MSTSDPICFAVELDVVDLSIPFLLARSTLTAMGAVMDFKNSELQLQDDRIIRLVPTFGGHLPFPWIFPKCLSVDSIPDDHSVPIYAAEEEPISELNQQQLTNVHVPFGHAGINTISRILQLAGKKWSPSLLQRIVQTCPRNRSS